MHCDRYRKIVRIRLCKLKYNLDMNEITYKFEKKDNIDAYIKYKLWRWKFDGQIN